MTERWLGADLPRVFAFFSDPTNLPRLMPRMLGVQLVRVDRKHPEPMAIKKVVECGMDPELVAGPGSLIEISIRLVPLLPFRAGWIAEILEYEPLSHFLDRQHSGPMRSWLHRHSFRAERRNEVSGTVIHDDVEYELPFGPLGRFLDWIFFQRMMQKTFQSRQHELERLLLR